MVFLIPLSKFVNFFNRLLLIIVDKFLDIICQFNFSWYCFLDKNDFLINKSLFLKILTMYFEIVDIFSFFLIFNV